MLTCLFLSLFSPLTLLRDLSIPSLPSSTSLPTHRWSWPPSNGTSKTAKHSTKRSTAPSPGKMTMSLSHRSVSLSLNQSVSPLISWWCAVKWIMAGYWYTKRVHHSLFFVCPDSSPSMDGGRIIHTKHTHKEALSSHPWQLHTVSLL